MNRADTSRRKMGGRGAKEPSKGRLGAPPKPLAAASERLRGKTGRPRKDGHVAGIAPAEVGVGKGPRWSALALSAIVPCLMSLEQAALYIGLSPWTVRDLIANGTLARVKVPLMNGKELRRLLIDKEDLDRVIEGWKERL